MAKSLNTSITDELHAELKANPDINASELTRAAIRKALDQKAVVALATDDLDAVAARLRLTQTEEDERLFADGRKQGIRYAREFATLSDLRQLGEEAKEAGWVDIRTGTMPWGDTAYGSLVDFIMRLRKEQSPEDWEPDEGFTFHEKYPWQRGVIVGAVEVWTQVKDRL
jgi:post-segregation antitoxin (ccd killing protein)